MGSGIIDIPIALNPGCSSLTTEICLYVGRCREHLPRPYQLRHFDLRFDAELERTLLLLRLGFCEISVGEDPGCYSVARDEGNIVSWCSWAQVTQQDIAEHAINRRG